MKAKHIIAFLMALTLTVALSACGNIDSEPAWESIEGEAEIEELENIVEEEIETKEVEKETETAEAENKELEKLEAKEVEEEETETDEAEIASETQTDESVATEKPAETKKPVQTEKPAETKKPAQTEKPAETKKPAQTEKPVETAAPVHEHTWKEHTATKQTWIPNIVVVDDYETQNIEYALCICDCDFESTDADVFSQHFKECFRAGNASRFTIQHHYRTEQVKVGSHEEDQGHYETSTYVDYYYCECGAKK